MTKTTFDTKSLVEEFLARGGTIQKVPEKNFRRDDYEAPELKRRNLMSALRERAAKMAPKSWPQ